MDSAADCALFGMSALVADRVAAFAAMVGEVVYGCFFDCPGKKRLGPDGEFQFCPADHAGLRVELFRQFFIGIANGFVKETNGEFEGLSAPSAFDQRGVTARYTRIRQSCASYFVAFGASKFDDRQPAHSTSARMVRRHEAKAKMLGKRSDSGHLP
ncbi:MAG TPA: hypothetical protein VLK33_00980, partial [Terriglobales bacterium]|nr:hypothetical protein [Terriglobales bacterium]